MIASRPEPSFNSSNSNGSQNTRCSVDFCLHEIQSLKKGNTDPLIVEPANTERLIMFFQKHSQSL